MPAAQTIQISVIRSRRRTLSLEVRPDGKVLVRAPLRCSDADIRAFVSSKEQWLLRSMKKMEEQRKAEIPGSGPADGAGGQADTAAGNADPRPYTRSELKALAEEAMKDLPQRCEKYAPLVGVDYGRITIRNQKTRWGSCSAKGNLNFNCLLMLAPPEVRDYVVVHELCHRKEMNHSPRFWAEVTRVLPDARERRKWLKEHGTAIMARGGR